jgi:Zn-dependent protease with chaperone function
MGVSKGMDFFTQQEKARKKTGLLVFFFIAAVLLIIAALYTAIAAILLVNKAVTDPFQPELLAGVIGITLAIVFAGSLIKMRQLKKGGCAVAEMLGARPVASDTKDFKEKQLLNVIEEMSIASGTVMPSVYILEEQGINAFAAGWKTSDAAVCVTRGCLEFLSRDELQGVIAHEFSHIFNGDMRLNIRLMGFIFGILVIGQIGYWVLRGTGRSQGVRVRSSKGKGGGSRGDPAHRAGVPGDRLYRRVLREPDQGRGVAQPGVPCRRLGGPVHPEPSGYRGRA